MEKRYVPELKFYKVDKKFLAFLYSEDKKKNGFSCVPTVNYAATQKEKFMCGVVLKVGGLDYFAPVSSYTTKQKDNVLLFDTENNVTSSIRLNFMFPAPKGVCNIYNFKQEVDKKYQSVVRRELQSANEQREIIQKQANKTYYIVRQMIAKGAAPKWACNFTYLEKLCKEWENRIEKEDPHKIGSENAGTKSDEKSESSADFCATEERGSRAAEMSEKGIEAAKERLKEMSPVYQLEVASGGKESADAKFERAFKSKAPKAHSSDRVQRSDKARSRKKQVGKGKSNGKA